MKATFYICMTYGAQGPEMQLTDGEARAISNLAREMTVAWNGPGIAGLALGPDHYVVYWEDAPDVDVIALRVDSSGYVSMWLKNNAGWYDYTDTVGLWNSLSYFGKIAYQKWLSEIQEDSKEDEETEGPPNL